MAKDNVQIIRLTTGEEILCKATKTETGWLVKNPVLIVPVNMENISLIPWLGYADHPDEGIEIQEKIVAFALQPASRLKSKYESIFSKIIAPDSGDIVGGADMAALGSKLRLST